MGDKVIGFTATVPLAFFTVDNVEMTEAFLENLTREPGLRKAYLYLNGGNDFAVDGRMICEDAAERGPFELIHAEGWPFYTMWNDGIERTTDIALVLNNDITWGRGALEKLARTLDQAPEDVALTYPRFEPDNRGLAGWCFAIRPEAFRKAGRIDSRYQTWYGDDELALNLKKAGYRSLAVESDIWHKVTATMKHRPGYEESIFEDMRLFEKKWPGVGIYGGKL